MYVKKCFIRETGSTRGCQKYSAIVTLPIKVVYNGLITLESHHFFE
jgi:hypothetical protein